MKTVENLADFIDLSDYQPGHGCRQIRMELLLGRAILAEQRFAGTRAT